MALPLPRVVSDVGPGGPLVTSMRGANALLNDIYGNQIKESEAQYAPWTNYANNASKMAYAQFVGPQAIAGMLNNPNARGMFTPEQYNQLASAFAQQVGPGNALGNMPVPGGRNQGLINHLLQRIGVISPDNVQPIPQQFSQGMPMPSGGVPGEIPSPSGYGTAPMSDERASPQMVADIAEHGNAGYGGTPLSSSPNSLVGASPSYNRQSNAFPEGTYGAASPGAIQQAGEAGFKAQTEAEGKAIADQWKNRQDEIRDEAKSSSGALNNIKRMKANYPYLKQNLETGPIQGQIKAFSGPAQDFDLAANDLMINKLKSWQANRVTNMDVQLAPSMKPGRYMNKEEFNRAADYEEAMQKRSQEYQPFALAAQKKGLLPAQADAIWMRYVNERPFYDYDNKKISHKNLQSWEDYLTPNKMQETFSPQFAQNMDAYRNNMAGGNANQDRQIHNQLNSSFDPTKILDYQFKSPEEFKSAFDSLNQKNKAIVIEEMRKRGWH
jgi:hypothetical protein